MPILHSSRALQSLGWRCEMHHTCLQYVWQLKVLASSLAAMTRFRRRLERHGAEVCQDLGAHRMEIPPFKADNIIAVDFRCTVLTAH
eukprot:4786934-Pleurochrysis_carterae.AAC.2